ncbi:MAG TPA: FAD-dependent oxidoreductase [Candidatus Avacidaminococcus intestinavium]|uniref:FAD-dependent oxidoreductase n=1 Tax=Candidatus Avacidaminococcus intestinavium TaxID=2840684 RepID=A0A9D1SMF3_9FIRM|nr:FAD-dependent oxidoreductase [Candidatus Avacidaminococcus intestinavium]
MKTYDLIVIGTGAGNIVLDAALAKGLKCAVIEKGRFGGTCLNRGCIPTKVLVTAADYLRQIEELPAIGVIVGKATMDWPVISRRVWEKINESKEVETYYQTFSNLDIYRGEAFFVAEKTLKIRQTEGYTAEITAEKIVVDIGAQTKLPQVSGRDETGYLSSESLFGEKYPKQPFESLIIIGGGPIGCEFAHIFSAAGTKVTLVQHNVRLLPKADEEVSAQILADMTKMGINVHLNADLVEMSKEQGQKKLVFANRSTGQTTIIIAEEIMFASGIEPVTERLQAAQGGLALEHGGWIKTNEFLETNVAGVYAIGDVNGKAAFRHKANYEAEILAHNLFEAQEPRAWRWARYDLVPAVTFTYPQIAQVGMTEKEAQQQGYNIKIGKQFYSNTAKGYALGLTKQSDGFIKLIVDEATDNLLGVHIIGHEAALLLQPFINLMNAGEVQLKPINEEIASEPVKELRKQEITRYLDPHKVQSISETMTPHPSLAEVAMWVQYYLK